MKLTEEQIQQVKDYIKNKDVEYIDLHFEVLDHIASDIEAKMSTLNLDFESAFKEVKEKWKSNFENSISFLIGPIIGGSKLYVDKCVRIYKPVLLKCILGIVLFILCFYSFKNLLKIEMDAIYPVLKISFLIMLVGFPFLFLFWRHKIKSSKLKSTFSHLFNKLILLHLFGGIVLLSQTLEIVQNYDFVYISFFPIMISIFYMGYTFYKKHFETVKKYQIV